MRIDGWHVDGFGILRDHEVHGLRDGLTAFLGPNEAGKSTLLAFLRGVLVGYPARGAASHYPPLNGGAHGGRVFLRGPDGDVTVERMVKPKVPRVVFPDRVDQGDEAVRRLLGGVDAGLFKSVFAFSLTELQDLRSLSEEGVRDRIFSAGIAGAGRSARQAAGRLDKEASALLRPQKGGLINGLMDRLVEAEGLLREAQAAASRYPRLLEDEEDALRRVEAAQAEIRSLRDRLRRHELLRELWPVYYDGEEARRELESLEPVDGMPDEPGERLVRVTDAVAAASQRLAELEAEAGEVRRSLEGGRALLRADLAALTPRVEGLADGLGVYMATVAALPEALAAADQAAEAAERRLAALGREWDEERLGSFDVSVSRVEEVREWGERLDASASAVEGRRRDHVAARTRLGEAEGEHDRLRRRAEAADPAEEERLLEDEAALRRIRADAQEARALDDKTEGLRDLVEDRERSLRAAEAAVGARGAGALGRLLGVPALACLAAAALLGWFVDPVWAAALGVPAAALGAAAYLLRASRGERHGGAAEIAALREALDTARANLGSAEERAKVPAGRMAADAVVLGLASRPTFAEIEARAAVLDVARERRREAEALRLRGGEAEEAAARVADLAAQAEALLREAEADDARLREEWLGWKATGGVPSELGAEGVAEFVRAVRVAQDAVEASKAARAGVERLRTKIAEWEEPVRAVLAEARVGGETGGEAGRAVGGGEALVFEFKRLREACVADRVQRGACSEAESALEKIERKLGLARGALERAEEDRAALFREGGAEDEAAFRARIALLGKRRGLEEAVAASRRALETRLGQGPDAAVLRDELATGRTEAWATEVERLREAVAQAEEEATEAIRLHRDAERSRQGLEDSSDVAARELELGGIRAELDRALRRWQVVTAARLLIEETLAEYSRTRRPPVLTEASADFARVTGGSYTQIVEDEDGEGFVVMDACGGMKTPEHLSRGTLEQLYLSLRLGLAAEFSRRAGSVPVIMDDVLVNFDPSRARATAEVLVSFAADHQVLFFTCHPATVDLLQKVDGGVGVVELGREGRRQGTLWEG